jgi:hypothetical protein
MPHLIHAAVSLTSGVVFFVVAVLLVSSSDWRSFCRMPYHPRKCLRFRFGTAPLELVESEHIRPRHHHDEVMRQRASRAAAPVHCADVLHVQVLGDHELEPMSRSLLAAPHSMCELRSLLCKTIITIADILLKPLPHVQTVLYTISCGLIFYYHARMVSASPDTM